MRSPAVGRGRQDLPFNPNPLHKHKRHGQSLAVGVVLVCVGEVHVALCFEKVGMKYGNLCRSAVEMSTNPAGYGRCASALGACGADRLVISFPSENTDPL